MDDKVPFLVYSRKRLKSAAGKSKDVENDSESKDPKNEAATKASKGKRTELTRKPKIEGDTETPLKKKRGADVEITLACLSSPERNASRLRPRKEVPSFRKIDLCNNDNRRIIGKRVKIYWSGSRRWFIGCVKAFHHRKRLHTILYEDGDKEELDLRKERFELEILPTENFHLSTEPNCGKKLFKDVKKDDELSEDAIRSDSESHLEKDTEDDVTVTDEVSDAEGTGCADSSKISVVENKTTITELVPCSKVKDTVSCDNSEGEDVLEDLSEEAEDGEALNRWVRSKKNMASRDSKIRSSKSRCKEGSEEMKRGGLDQDVHHNSVNTNLGQCDFNVEGCQKVDDQEKREKKTESLAGKANQDHGISYETQLSNSGSDGTKEEDGFYDVKVKWETGEKVGKQADELMSLNRKEEDVFPFVRSINRGVNVRRPRTMKTYVDMESFAKAGEKKSENRKSGENLSKEKELGSKRAGAVRKSENIGNAESQKNPIRRKRSAVISK